MQVHERPRAGFQAELPRQEQGAPKTAKEGKQKMTAHRLTIKGQVTIPKEIREYLGLAEGGSSVDFSIAPDGSVILRKAAVAEDRAASHGAAVRRPVHGAASARSVPAARGVLALLAGGL